MMLPPHELKGKRFSKSFHGYSPEEVDDQIAFLLEQYTSLYRENDELERKLKLAQAQLDAYQDDEENLREALVGAQKAGEKIIAEANERADMLLKAAKETTDRMVNESAIRIREQMRILGQLREQASTLKKTLLAQYEQQIAQITATAEHETDAGMEAERLADEEMVRTIIAGIKDEATRMVAQSAPTIKRRARSGTIWSKRGKKDDGTDVEPLLLASAPVEPSTDALSEQGAEAPSETAAMTEKTVQPTEELSDRAEE